MFFAVVLGMLPAATADTAAAGDPRCGTYCLYVCLKGVGAQVPPFSDFDREVGPPPAAGHSLGRLAEVAHAYGLQTLGVRTDIARLQRRTGQFACIARVNGDHFVVLAGTADGMAHVIDPPRSRKIPVETFAAAWDGTALLISMAPLLPEEEIPRSSQRPGWQILLPLAALILGPCLLLTLWLARKQVA